MRSLIGTRSLLALGLMLCAWQALPAAVVPYDIVYVRAPRGGDSEPPRFAESARPMWVQPGSDLVVLRADGTQEVLVRAGDKGAVADPCVTFDGKSVLYAYSPDVVTQNNLQVPVGGFDIYRVEVSTKRITRLTNQERTPNTSLPNPGNYPVYNMGPCPVSGGKIVFTSTRDNFISPHAYTPLTSQLYVMNEDGSELMAISPMTLGAALHPYQMTDGTISFSTAESQGLRDNRSWGMWTIWPDGRQWSPKMSAFSRESVFHFFAELSNRDWVVEDYYNLFNGGFGTFYRVPAPKAGAVVGFHPAEEAKNPPLVYTHQTLGKTQVQIPFSPTGIFSVTPFATFLDEASGIGRDGQRLGKVMHPSGAPNNDLLLVWSPGPVNFQNRPTQLPYPDAGIYIAKNGGPVETPADLVRVLNDPAYNEIWPRALVSYKAIYGIDEPHRFPFLPNDGTEHPALPAGTPYGIVGTSSFYKRESAPGRCHRPGLNYDGLDPFNMFVDGGCSNWISQGSDAGKYSNDEIAAVRIVIMEPTSVGERKWFNHANERLRVLGEIPLRKQNADGSVVRDPEGNPDTSFWAKLPADTPFTFQMLDASGRLLTMAQTWHQVRPGEVRVDCGGCHSHSQTPLAFERTAAAKLLPADLTLKPAHDVEFVRDVRPILQAKCVSCHGGKAPVASLALDSTEVAIGVAPDPPQGLPKDYAVLARNAAAAHGGYKAVQPWYGFLNASRYVRKFQSRRSLLIWKLAGSRLDGWQNADWPTERVPGDATTLPAGASKQLADLDYSDTANHAAMLSTAEQRLITAWIDLGAPIDLGGGFWQDEIRPTLAASVSDGALIIGAADAYSGLDQGSLKVTVDGKSMKLTGLGDGRWTTTFPSAAAARVVASVKDRAGNLTQLTRILSHTQRAAHTALRVSP